VAEAREHSSLAKSDVLHPARPTHSQLTAAIPELPVSLIATSRFGTLASDLRSGSAAAHASLCHLRSQNNRFLRRLITTAAGPLSATTSEQRRHGDQQRTVQGVLAGDLSTLGPDASWSAVRIR